MWEECHLAAPQATAHPVHSPSLPHDQFGGPTPEKKLEGHAPSIFLGLTPDA
jgi:hypothetical protein